MNRFVLLVALIVISAAAFVLFMTALSAAGQPGAPGEIAVLPSSSLNESTTLCKAGNEPSNSSGVPL